MKAYESKTMDGEVLRLILISGSNFLFNNYPDIDALNVFPVPDGDTGTNMNLTLTSGAKEIMNIRNDKISEVGKLFSRGLLMGARGNSGVILSQIFRGFVLRLENKEHINITEFAECWIGGAEMAYKAVMRPVEGTILTVIREAAETLKQNIEKAPNIGRAMEILLDEAKASLLRTPNLLPVLKEVGVVDSGGAGLIKILEGMLTGLRGEIVERKQLSFPQPTETTTPFAKFENEEFGYCTEFIVRLVGDKTKKKFDQERFTSLISSLGGSLVVVRDEDLVKVHVHTLKPGTALNYAQQYGEFVSLKIENMQEQHSHLTDDHAAEFKEKNPVSEARPAPDKISIVEKKAQAEFAIIAVAVGEGVTQMFKDLRVDYVVSGGQSMNPSTEDFVKAIETVNAKNIFLLPNNKNIQLAAEQAASVVEGRNVKVIPTKTIPQGLTACMMFNPEADFDSNLGEMNDAAKRVKSGAITFAIKDTTIDKVEIKKDYFMGILESKIVCAEKDINQACYKLLDKMINEESAIISIIYGEGVSEKQAQALAKKIATEKSIEVEVHKGDQPTYSYYFGVE
jgi:DAK2 domain fusion protein YloV